MSQLQLSFETLISFEAPVSFETPKVKPDRPFLPPPKPSKDGNYNILLGIRYSLAEVEGWCAVKDFKHRRGHETNWMFPSKTVVWVDPTTIKSAHTNSNKSPCWGFGPLYSAETGQRVDHTYRRHWERERVSFDFVDYASYELASNVIKERIKRINEENCKRREAADPLGLKAKQEHDALLDQARIDAAWEVKRDQKIQDL